MWFMEGKGDEGASMHKAGAVLSTFVDVVEFEVVIGGQDKCFTLDACNTSYLESELPEN